MRTFFIVYFSFLEITYLFNNRAPDSSPVKKKMIYAGSKDALTSALVGIMVKVTATDFSELTSDILQSNASKFN